MPFDSHELKSYLHKQKYHIKSKRKNGCVFIYLPLITNLHESYKIFNE